MTTDGGINSVFQDFGGTDTLGFDGIWRLAATVRLLDTVSLRYGLHHFSGHWGDEIVEDLPRPGDADYIPYNNLEEYVRASSYVFGMSVNPEPWARLYFEAELPMEECWLRPGVHVPAGLTSPSGDDLAYHILNQEGLHGGSAGVRARAIALGGSRPGLSLRWAFGRLGFDLRGRATSSSIRTDRPCIKSADTTRRILGSMSTTVGGGVEYSKGFLGRKIRVEAFYPRRPIPAHELFLPAQPLCFPGARHQ